MDVITDRLAAAHDVLAHQSRVLTAADTRRMYPDAYGPDFIAAVDAYLTSGPSHLLLPRSHDPDATADIKTRIRNDLGGDRLRIHLHMPDNPSEALADIAHLAGWTALYERADDDATDDAARLAFYRAALGVREASRSSRDQQTFNQWLSLQTD